MCVPVKIGLKIPSGYLDNDETVLMVSFGGHTLCNIRLRQMEDWKMLDQKPLMITGWNV